MLAGQLPGLENSELDVKPSHVFGIETHCKDLEAVVWVNVATNSLLRCLHLPS